MYKITNLYKMHSVPLSEFRANASAMLDLVEKGETVDLPVGGGYFVMGNNPNERYVLSVRHPDAKGPARSGQPVYRQDGARSSNYLQLLPSGKLPAVEQVLSARTN